MKVLLIWPKGFEVKTVLPLSLAYLKSNLDPKKHEITLLDCALNDIAADSGEFKRKILEVRPDVVGVSCWSFLYAEALIVFDVVKSLLPDITTIIGGVHATAYASKCISEKNIDYVFTGEGEIGVSSFLDQLESAEPDWSNVKGLVYLDGKGNLIRNPPDRIEKLDSLSLPDYDAIELDRYIEAGYRYLASSKRNAPIWVTRGCPYTCRYCTGPLQNGRIIRKHSIEYVVDWVKYLYFEKGIRYINIIDDNFTFDVDYAKEFCQTIIKLGLKGLQFGTPNGIRMQRSTPDLFPLMKKAGWRALVVAPESGSPATLKRMHKALDPAIVPGKVQEIKAAGLKVFAFFIIGYPGDTVDDLMMTKELIRKCDFDFAYIVNFQPLPGTPVYDDLVNAGEIEEGLLPENVNIGEGSRIYTPKELEDFNFSRFVMGIWFDLALRKPSIIFYILKRVNFLFIFKRLFKHFLRSI